MNSLMRHWSRLYVGLCRHVRPTNIIRTNATLPTHYNFAKDVIDKHANSKAKDVRALWIADEKAEDYGITYQELAQQSCAMAGALRELGLQEKDCMLLILPKIPPWWILSVAASRIGVVVCPGTSMLTAKDIVHRINVAEAKAIVCDRNTAEKVDAISSSCPTLQHRILVSGTKPRSGWSLLEEVVRSCKPVTSCVETLYDDPVQLFFTSGTTGMPKAVVHTQGSYGFGHIMPARKWLRLREGDVLWNISDTGWAKAAWSSYYIPFLMGVTAFQHKMAAFNARLMLDTLCNYPITTLCAPPTVYRALVQEDLGQKKLHSLRVCISAGEPLNPEVSHEWIRHTGLQILEGYGQTETTLLCGTIEGMEYREGSIGMATDPYQIEIVDENGEELAASKEGMIGVRVKPEYPPGLFKGYLKQPEATARCFKGDYYLTGDKAYKDKDGYIFFVGRSDDVITSAGYRIGPFEVESALIEHPSVAEAAAVASPDSYRGAVVKAFIILSPSYRQADQEKLVKELQEFVKERTAPYKYPRKIEFVDTLPKTISGKIRRKELRDQEYQRG